MKTRASRAKFETIKRDTCAEFRIDVALFDSPSRVSTACAARRLAWWRARRAHEVSHAQLGAWSGGRDSSTVWHSVASLEHWLQGKEFKHGVRKRAASLVRWRAKKARGEI